MVVQQWLDLICQMLPNASRGILLCDFDAPGRQPVACWPNPGVAYADLAGAAMLAADRDAPVVSSQRGNDPTNQSGDLMTAFPLRLDGRLFGVVAVHLNAAVAHQSVVNQLLQWGQAWLKLLLQAPADPSSAQPLPSLGVLEAGFRHSEIAAAASAVASALKQALSCERVTLGLIQDKRPRVQGMSDVSQFDARMNAITVIEAAMRELVAQGASIRAPQRIDSESDIAAHRALTEATGRESLCSVPLLHQDAIIGVILCERAAGQAFSDTELHRCEDLGKLLGAQFALKRQQQRSLFAELLEAGLNPLRKLLGPGHFKLKMSVSLAATAVLALTLTRGDYRVSAPAALEGKIQRAVVAPFDGYVARAHARAGETVNAGDIIAELEDRQLSLERERWLSERDELSKHYRKALVELDHSQTRIYQAQVAQAEAQLKLIDQQLRRAQLSAPIDGIIISGDLSRGLGAPVERGDVLFEVAPLNEYRIVLDVSEREIRDIGEGQQGWLSLTALPDQKIPFTIQRVATVFEEHEGKVIYRTEARATQAFAHLRPGMRGVGKIEIEQRSYGWILFHNMLDWLRIQLWSRLP